MPAFPRSVDSIPLAEAKRGNATHAIPDSQENSYKN